MRKEYFNEAIDLYKEVLDENGEVTYEPTGETKEVTITVLIAEGGGHFVDQHGTRLGNVIEVGTADDENSYTEAI